MPTRDADLPNTRLQPDLLAENVILCCGEDRQTVLAAVPPGPAPLAEHHFRSYSFYRYQDHTLVLSAIGTGCLEPLLYEMLSLKKVTRIVLIGTAGALPGSRATLGEVYAIEAARVSATALDQDAGEAPRAPRWSGPVGLPTATSVSTDLYYGFTDAAEGPYLRHFRNVARQASGRSADLVDMEVAQFYTLCSFAADISEVEYLAVKGPANRVTNHEEQNLHTPAVLAKAFRAAFALLGLEFRPAGAAPAAAPKPEADMTKLIGEIKLYWTIQIAIGAMLGVIPSVFGKNSYAALIICLSLFLLLTIGSVYNIIGNYYIRIEGARIGLGGHQENVITPYLCKIYCVIAAILGGYIGYCVALALDLGGGAWSHALVGLGSLGCLYAVYAIQGRIFHSLLAGSPECYRDYARPLRAMFPTWLVPFLPRSARP